MSRTFHNGERRIRVHGTRKDPPDLKRLAKAMIELARLQAEAAAEAEDDDKREDPPGRQSSQGDDGMSSGDAA